MSILSFNRYLSCMSIEPLISVVIPAFNAQKFIQDAIYSIFSQTYRPLEIIVVNDCSLDLTSEIAHSLEAKCPDKIELKVIDLKQNEGAANALNTGFIQAKGEYICWLSADDYYVDKNKIENQYTHMKNNGYLLSYDKGHIEGSSLQNVISVTQNFLPFTKIFDKLFLNDTNVLLLLTLLRNPINGSTIMMSKTCFDTCGNFDATLRNIDADADLWLRYCALGVRMGPINQCSVFYRLHEDQTSKDTKKMMYGCELVRLRILSIISSNENFQTSIKRFFPVYIILLVTRHQNGFPYTSKFLFDYLIKNKSLNFLNEFLLKLVYNKLIPADELSSIDIDKLHEDVMKSMSSDEFIRFTSKYKRG